MIAWPDTSWRDTAATEFRCRPWHPSPGIHFVAIPGSVPRVSQSSIVSIVDIPTPAACAPARRADLNLAFLSSS